MRIRKGHLKGKTIKNIWGADVRPTTDHAKKGLFDYLANQIDFSGKTVLDLFSGSGIISLTFLSMDVAKVTSIDNNKNNCIFLNKYIYENKIDNWDIISSDVIKWIEVSENTYDIVFADPPYMMEGIHLFKEKVITKLVRPGGLFILEHHQHLVFSDEQLLARKQYGKSCFSIFKC